MDSFVSMDALEMEKFVEAVVEEDGVPKLSSILLLRT